jgi:hypothetical protein
MVLWGLAEGEPVDLRAGIASTEGGIIPSEVHMLRCDGRPRGADE